MKMNITSQEKMVLDSLPWGELIPLAIELIQEARLNGLFSDRAIELIIEIVQLVIASMQQQGTMSADNWQSLIQLLIKFLPIIIELIGKMSPQQASPQQSPWLLSRELAEALASPKS